MSEAPTDQENPNPNPSPDDEGDPDAVYVTRDKAKDEEESDGNDVPRKPRALPKRRPKEVSIVPLWLISFTDVMALMLTFFVLLFSMATPKKEEWQELKSALVDQFSQYYSQPFFKGRLDLIDLRMSLFAQALDLSYLRNLLEENLSKDKSLKSIRITQQDKHLVLSLPENLLFTSGKDQLKENGRDALFSITSILSGISNRIEIVGHADPTPLSRNSKFSSNWELSLSRALSVSKELRSNGYGREMKIRGASSGRFSAIDSALSENDRKKLSRRVDIVIMEDDGDKL